jgi:hypothetical protein
MISFTVINSMCHDIISIGLGVLWYMYVEFILSMPPDCLGDIKFFQQKIILCMLLAGRWKSGSACGGSSGNFLMHLDFPQLHW